MKAGDLKPLSVEEIIQGHHVVPVKEKTDEDVVREVRGIFETLTKDLVAVYHERGLIFSITLGQPPDYKLTSFKAIKEIKI